MPVRSRRTGAVRSVAVLSVVALSAAMLTALTVPPGTHGARGSDPAASGGPVRQPADEGHDPRPGSAFVSPEVRELQRSAASIQRELGALADDLDTARAERDRATRELERARERRREAEGALAALRDEVDSFTRTMFTTMGRADGLRVAITAANGRDLLDGTSLLGRIRAEQNAVLTDALERHRSAVRAERAAERARTEAEQRRETLRRRGADAVNRADAVSAELRGPLARADEAVAAQQRAQRERGERTAQAWQRYRDRLAAAGVTPPPARALRDPGSLPADLDPVRGADGEAQRGVARTTGAEGERLLVLPRETVDAVSAAIEALGRPYVPHRHDEGPVAYSCDGLVHAVYGGAGVELPASAREQLATGTRVPVAEARPGDLIFTGPARYGVRSVGIVLDDESVVTADAMAAGVAVLDRPEDDAVLGVVRPVLGTGPAREVPSRADGELPWHCGGVDLEGGGTPGADAAAQGAAGPWGGYPNGMIPGAALCPFGPEGHVLRCDAAQAYRALSERFARRFGEPLCVTDSYRTFDAQVDLYRRKPALAAVPGTSNHGWGLAVDLCGGVESFGTPAHRWMRANAPALGWVHPAWARQGGGREEPWHWEYTG